MRRMDRMRGATGVLKALLRRKKIIQLAFRLYRIYGRIQRLTSTVGADDDIEKLQEQAGREIRDTANHLGGAIVKIGQFLSLREELFPRPFVRQLEGLEDAVPAASFGAVSTVFRTELGVSPRSVFQRMDEIPVASASLAQVHRAVLRNGTEVAVKVLRPGIEDAVKIDMATLKHLANIFRHLPTLNRRFDFQALHREFSQTLARELDMRTEANQMEAFREFIALDDRVFIPCVYRDFTAKRVLVMSYVEGTKVRDLSQLKDWGVNPSEVRNTLLDIYLKQILWIGVVHLDPHPGNLLVLPDGRIALIDFGMVGYYSDEERRSFRTLIQSLFFGNIDGVVAILQDLGYLDKGAVLSDFTDYLRTLLEGGGLQPLQRLWSFPAFSLQARYMLLMRCLGLLKSALYMLTPEEVEWSGVISAHAFPFLANVD